MEESILKKWYIALRPWSFTAATVPICLGTVWAWYMGYFDLIIFILSILAGIAIQAGTNLINTYGDYESGVDTLDSAKSCPVLVEGWLKPQQIKIAGLSFFVLAFCIGVYLTFIRGWFLLALGLLGIAGGYSYTKGISFKYRGLGSTLVFFLMGPLMVWGAYFAQTGQHSSSAVLISLPIGFLVSGILHANDIRDLDYDKSAGIQTLALKMGRKKSLLLHCFNYISAFISILLLTLFKILPLWSFLAVLFVLPAGIKLMKDAGKALKGNPEKLQILEMEAAHFHFKFGTLIVLGVLIGKVAI